MNWSLMGESFVVACNAVLPIVVLVIVGYILRRLNIISESFQKQGNKFCFKIMISILLFCNIYAIEDIIKIGDYGIFILEVAIAITILFLIGIVVVKLCIKDSKQQGVVHQCLFRSNYAIIGIPLATFIATSLGYAEDSDIVGIASLVSAISIPLFNVFAVISLSMYDKGENGHIDIKKMLKGIITNPLIIGVLTGLVALAIRQILIVCNVSWRLSDIVFIYKPLTQIGNMATPFALLMLGAGFTFSAVAKLKYQIILGTVIRIALVPAVFLISFYFILDAQFGSATIYFPALIALFSTPVAVSSAPMAVEMGQDGELAGQLVVWTSLFSILSLFIIIMISVNTGVLPIQG